MSDIEKNAELMEDETDMPITEPDAQPDTASTLDQQDEPDTEQQNATAGEEDGDEADDALDMTADEPAPTTPVEEKPAPRAAKPRGRRKAAAPAEQPEEPQRRQTTIGTLSDIAHDTFQEDLEGGRVISIGGTLEAKTEAKRVLETVQKLAGSFRNRQPLAAVLTEIMTIEGRDPIPVATFEEFRIMLSPRDFISGDKLKELRSTPNRAAAIRSRLQKRIGSEIEFIVKSAKGGDGADAVDPDHRLAVGDRVAAMLARRSQYWAPDEDGESIIKAGSRVEARVVSVRPQAIVIEAMGVEIAIPVREVSSVYIRDLTTDGPYHVGDKVVALITKADVENARTIEAEASIRVLEANPQTKEAKRLAPMLDGHGSITQVGEVVYIDQMNTYVLVRIQGGAVCRCPQNTAGRVALKGDLWSVKVSRVDTEKGFIDGYLTHYIR